MSRRVYRALLRLLPASFRARHGAAMEDAFGQRVEEARTEGHGAVVRLVVREVLDLAGTALRLRLSLAGRRRSATTRLTRIAGRTHAAGGGGLTGLADDVRHAFRSLVRRPAFTLFATLTVALGVGATTAVFSVVERVLLRPIPFEGGNRMVGLWRAIGTSGRYMTPSAGMVEVWSEQEDLFETVEPYAIRYMTLTGAGEPAQLRVGLVRPSYPGFLGLAPQLGRVFTEDEMRRGARVALLGHQTWVERFGADPTVPGRTVSLDGEPWTVVGVMPPEARLVWFELADVQVWRPLTEELRSRGGVSAVATMRAGVTLEAVNDRLGVLDERLREDAGQPADAHAVALLLREVFSRSLDEALRILMVAVALLLAITCVNVSNLLLHRSASRRRETAVRAALGGGGPRLARQMLAESLLLALVGGAAGTALAYAGVEAMLALRPAELSVLDRTGVDGRILLFSLAVTVGTGILFGLLPAWHALRSDALGSLGSGAREDDGVPGRRARWILVTGEVALSFPLLVGALVGLGSLLRLQQADPGFRTDEVVVADLDLPSWAYRSEAEREGVFERVRRRLEVLPGVIRVASASGAPPSTGIWFGTVQVEGDEPTADTGVLHGPGVDESYFATTGQPLLEGRGFTEDEIRRRADVVVVGEGMARSFFPEGDAVGRRFRVGDGGWRTVVGVTGDVAMTDLSAGPRPLQAYHPLRAESGRRTFLLRAADARAAEALIPLARQVVREIDAELRIDGLATARTRMLATLAHERFSGVLLATFAGLALVLAAVGLFGVISRVVGRRTREIGIRMALGARARTIQTMVLRRAAAAVVVGIGLGAAVAALGLPFLEGHVLDVEGRGLTTYGSTALVLAVTGLLAAWIPAHRATRIDPGEALAAD